MTHEFEFRTDKEIEQLLPCEALALINRWAKLKDWFYYDDRDLLYDLKDQKINEWLLSGELRAVSVLRRQNPMIEKMKAQCANGGADLELLNHVAIDEVLGDEYSFYSILSDLTDGGVEIELPTEDEAEQLLAYKQAIAEYQIDMQTYQELLRDYQLVSGTYEKLKEAAAMPSAASNAWIDQNPQLSKSPKVKNRRRGWIRELEKSGFVYPEAAPVPPALQKPIYPWSPSVTTIEVSWENYVPGSIPEIEEALEWCKQLMGDKFPGTFVEIDNNFVCDDLENKVKDQYLEETRSFALDTFQQVIDGKLTNPREIWEDLTAYDLNYSEAIGMKNYYNRYTQNHHHGEFEKWHEINLSPTGYWLVEFQSTVNPDIIFHTPYDAATKRSGVETSSLPEVDSDQQKFGRAISGEEMLRYPIRALVGIFGLDEEDFPYELNKYQSSSWDGFMSWYSNDYGDYGDDEVEDYA